MIAVLIQGRLNATPVARTSSRGNKFATALIRATADDGTTTWVSVIAFSEDAVEGLLALREGDSVAVAGEASLHTFETSSGETRAQLRVTATRCLSVHQAKRQRKAAAAASEGEEPAAADLADTH